MKSTALPLLLGFVLLNSCKKDKESVPEYIQLAVTNFSNYSCEHGAEVKQNTFQDKSVYTFYIGNCGADLTTSVVDANCNTLGHLDGRTPNYRINGEEFSNAKYVRTIWSRP